MKEYVQLVCLLLFCYGGILKAENLHFQAFEVSILLDGIWYGPIN